MSQPAAAGATTTAVVTINPQTGAITAPQGYTVQTIPDTAGAPDYTAPLTFKTQLSADVEQALQAQYAADQGILRKDPHDFSAWVNMGTINKMAGNYPTAALYWEYTTQLYPGSTVPSDNLGSLYLDFIKDYAKAQMYFGRSLQADPKDITAYENLFALYTTYGYRGNMTAAQVVASGLKANPNNSELLQLQSQLSH